MRKEIKLAAVVRRIKELTIPLPPISQQAEGVSSPISGAETPKPAMPKTKRSLYMCANARVSGDWINCRAGHSLDELSKTGSARLRRLRNGERLEFTICQNCPDYDETGPPVPNGERGWPEVGL